GEVSGGGDDHLAGLQAAGDVDAVALGVVAERYVALDGLAVLDEEDLLNAGEGDDGGRRHGDDRLGDGRRDLGAGEATGPQRAAPVLDLDLDDEHAALLVDDGAQARDAAGEVLGLSLGSH